MPNIIQPYYLDFIKESNKIEGIHREPSQAEIDEFLRFLHLDKVTVKDLKKFIFVYAPGHVLRNKKNLNVSVGGYYAPTGDPYIKTKLEYILSDLHISTPYQTHVSYELLHPFTDGNGRSGRMLWAWQMNNSKDGWNREAWTSLGFLHTYYYQSLQNERK